MLAKKKILASFLNATGIAPALRHVKSWTGLLVLNYHRIGDGRRSMFDRGLWSASEAEFDSQVGFLKKHFDVISADEISDALQARRGQSVLLTFDDGYRDNYELAVPILRRHRVSALFFLTTGFLDDGRLAWWDDIAWMVRNSRLKSLPPSRWISQSLDLSETHRESSIKKLLTAYKFLPGSSTADFMDYLSATLGSERCPLPVVPEIWLTWDRVREMRAVGMSIGAHSATHPVLSRLSPDQQLWEIRHSLTRVREELGEATRWFSYPVGKPNCFDAHTKRHVSDSGVTHAFSFYGGLNVRGRWDPLDMRRVAVTRDLSAGVFEASATLPQMFCPSNPNYKVPSE